MSVQDLAIYSRISARHIWRLERGERPNPSVNTVARLAIALETTLEYLVGMTNDQVSLHQLSATLEERR
jgi:transcriptional regulator with XRE-family HTH domain